MCARFLTGSSPSKIVFYFHRIIELFELEGTLKGHLVQLPCNEQGHPQLHQVLRSLSSLALGVSRDGVSTTSLGNLCQCLTTLTITIFFLIFSPNLPSCSLKPSPLVLSPQSYYQRVCSRCSCRSLLDTERPISGHLTAFSRLNSPSALSLYL